MRDQVFQFAITAASHTCFGVAPTSIDKVVSGSFLHASRDDGEVWTPPMSTILKVVNR